MLRRKQESDIFVKRGMRKTNFGQGVYYTNIYIVFYGTTFVGEMMLET